MRISVLSFALLLVLHSCDQTTSPQRMPTNFYPLAVGNSWTYHIVRYDSMGAILQTLDQTISLVGDTVIHGTVWYSYDANKYSLIARKSDGYHLKQSNLEGIAWKLPASSPQRYTTPSDPPLPPDSTSYVQVEIYGTDGVLYTGVNKGRVFSRVYFRENVGMTQVITYWYRSTGEQVVNVISNLMSSSIN